MVLDKIRGRDLFVSVLSLAELAFWLTRQGVEPTEYLESVKKNATILAVDESLAEEAGRRLAKLRSTSPGMGLVDAILYVQSQSCGLTLVTGDPHFKGLAGVEFIG